MENHPIIFFDGVCNLCSGSVQFIIARDPKARFRFSSLQSDFAKERLGAQAEALSSIVLVEGDKKYERSAAILRILRRLRWPWPLLSAGIVIPRFIRDRVYNWIAKNRYDWFGKKNECWLPTPDLKNRFLN